MTSSSDGPDKPATFNSDKYRDLLDEARAARKAAPIIEDVIVEPAFKNGAPVANGPAKDIGADADGQDGIASTSTPGTDEAVAAAATGVADKPPGAGKAKAKAAKASPNWHSQAITAGYANQALPIMPPGVTLNASSRVNVLSIGKVPGLQKPDGTWVGFANWQIPSAATIEDARAWEQWGAGLGFRTGIGGLAAIDNDITDRALADVPRALLYSLAPGVRLPERTVAHADHVKSLFLCVVVDEHDNPVELGTTNIGFETPAGEPQQVQVLGKGAYFNARGQHPLRHAPYAWDIDPLTLGFAGLPRIPLDVFRAFIAQLPEALAQAGARVTSKGHAWLAQDWKAVSKRETVPNASLVSLMEIMPNKVKGYDAWIDFGLMVKGAAEDPDGLELFEGFEKYSGRWEGPWNKAKYQDPAIKWSSFDPVYKHAGSLRHWLVPLMTQPAPGDPDFDAKQKIATELGKLVWFAKAPFTTVETEETPEPAEPGFSPTWTSRMARLARRSTSPQEYD